MDLFHALGKVLYAKREEGAAENDSALKPELRRSPLLSDPEEVLSRAPASPESFSCFLHQNYPPFFTAVGDLAEAADRISRADPFFVEWTVRNWLAIPKTWKVILGKRLNFCSSTRARPP